MSRQVVVGGEMPPCALALQGALYPDSTQSATEIVKVVAFSAVPPIGTAIVLRGHAYRLVAVEPYTRKSDGAASGLLTWESRCCADDCAATFTVVTGLRHASGVRKACNIHRGRKPKRKNRA